MEPTMNKALKEAVKKRVRSGLLGPMKDIGLTIHEVSCDNASVTFYVGVMSLAALRQGGDATMDWYVVQVANKHYDDLNHDLHILQTRSVYLTDEDVKEVIREAGLGTVVRSQRLKAGASMTYASWVDAAEAAEKDLPTAFVVQLRLFGQVRSMDGLQNYIRASKLPALPVPRTFATNSPHLETANLQLQITEFMEGRTAYEVYHGLGEDDTEGRLMIVRQMARAHAGIWELPLSTGRDIGDAVFEGDGEDSGKITVVPDRVLGGPFSKPTDYLAAWIRYRLEQLEDQNSVDEYKEEVLVAIREFVLGDGEGQDCSSPSPMDVLLSGKGGVHLAVNDVPVVLQHADLGLHNVLLAPTDLAVRAIIDWEFLSCQPWVMAIDRFIEPLFQCSRQSNPILGDAETEILRAAFWDEIPVWRAQKETQASVEFHEWYGFGRVLKAEAHPDPHATREEEQASWAENTRKVKAFLAKWGSKTTL